ncbi:MAG: UDP-N-acetylglucosamine 2-epimerase (non-hydrolyzing) [Proteobacteria bacterium]|nr:UDP-N-acetylglucosamine 2-epimerase (non-hydrolyzing) [Pseudomonadota bacterium]
MNSKSKIVDLVAGARPNFMKLSPVVRAFDSLGGTGYRIVHTGQHYDFGMNEVFFKELGIPEPDVHLEVGSGSHGVQTARILEKYEAHLLESRPDATVVFGDVNSTVACSLAAVKLGVPVVHVEAGLRSFDRTMPEEINRILTDSIADLLLVSEPSGMENLAREGISKEKIRHVGNVMIDTLLRERQRKPDTEILEKLGLEKKGYGLLTMHRPSNVDDPDTLRRLMELLVELSNKLPLVLPIHPRTRNAVDKAGLGDLLEGASNFHVADPLPYHSNLALMESAKLVLTDSGGIQEETAILKVPCLTMRFNTERPVTVDRGTSRLVGNDVEKIRLAFDDVMGGRWQEGREIELWDGCAGERVALEIGGWLELG